MRRVSCYRLFLWGLLPAVVALIFTVPARPDGKVLSSRTDARPAATFPAVNGLPDPNVILAMVNEVRRQNGLGPLAADDSLGAIARERAEEMSRLSYYAHRGPDGRYFYDLMDERGVPSDAACENLDLGYGMQAKAYVDDWLSSRSGHRECLLNPISGTAGYAAAAMPDLPYGEGKRTAVVVVAIHARSSQQLSVIPIPWQPAFVGLQI